MVIGFVGFRSERRSGGRMAEDEGWSSQVGVLVRRLVNPDRRRRCRERERLLFDPDRVGSVWVVRSDPSQPPLFHGRFVDDVGFGFLRSADRLILRLEVRLGVDLRVGWLPHRRLGIVGKRKEGCARRLGVVVGGRRRWLLGLLLGRVTDGLVLLLDEID